MLHIQNGQPFQEQFTVYHAVFQAFAKPIAVKFGEFFKIFENLCLVAVAVGTSHGVYVHEPKLDFERLELLNSISDIPMVVHGGSGTPDDQIKKAISLGVTKLNIYSEMMAAYFGTMKEELEKAGTMAIWMSNANREPLKAVKKVVKEKIRLTGSAGKA